MSADKTIFEKMFNHVNPNVGSTAENVAKKEEAAKTLGQSIQENVKMDAAMRPEVVKESEEVEMLNNMHRKDFGDVEDIESESEDSASPDFRLLLKGVQKDVSTKYADTCGICPDVDGDIIPIGSETAKSSARHDEVEQHMKDLAKEVGQNTVQQQVTAHQTEADELPKQEPEVHTAIMSEEPKEEIVCEEPAGEISTEDEVEGEEVFEVNGPAKLSKVAEERDPWLPHVAGQCMVCKKPATIKDAKGGEYCSPECQKSPAPKSKMRTFSYPTELGVVGRPAALESKKLKETSGEADHYQVIGISKPKDIKETTVDICWKYAGKSGVVGGQFESVEDFLRKSSDRSLEWYQVDGQDKVSMIEAKIKPLSEAGKKVFKAASPDDISKRPNSAKYSECDICKQPMNPHNEGCWSHMIDSKGEWVERIPYGGEGEDTSMPCGDCNVKSFGYHHDGCDSEHCPRCGGQMLGCECDWTSIGKRKAKSPRAVESKKHEFGDSTVSDFRGIFEGAKKIKEASTLEPGDDDLSPTEEDWKSEETFPILRPTTPERKPTDEGAFEDYLWKMDVKELRELLSSDRTKGDADRLSRRELQIVNTVIRRKELGERKVSEAGENNPGYWTRTKKGKRKWNSTKAYTQTPGTKPCKSCGKDMAEEGADECNDCFLDHNSPVEEAKKVNEDGMAPGGGSGTVAAMASAIPPTKVDRNKMPDSVPAQNPETHDNTEKQPEANEQGDKEYFGKQGDDNYYYLLSVPAEDEGSQGGISSEEKPDVTPNVAQAEEAPAEEKTPESMVAGFKESVDPANDFHFIKEQLSELLKSWESIASRQDSMGNVKGRLEALVNAMNEAKINEEDTLAGTQNFASLQIIDASGKVVKDDKSAEKSTDNIKNFLLQAMDELELTELAPDIVKKYLLADEVSTEDDEMTKTPSEDETNKVQGEPPTKTEKPKPGQNMASESIDKLMEKFNLSEKKEDTDMNEFNINIMLDKFGLGEPTVVESLLEKYKLNEAPEVFKAKQAKGAPEEKPRDRDLTGEPMVPKDLPAGEAPIADPSAPGETIPGTPNNLAGEPTEDPAVGQVDPGVTAPVGGGVPGGLAEPLAPTAAQDMSSPESSKAYIQSEYPEEPFTSTALAYADSMIADPNVYGKVRNMQWGGIWSDAETLKKQAKIVGDYGNFSPDTVEAITDRFGNTAKYKLARDVRPVIFITVRDVGDGVEPISLSELKGLSGAREVQATENPGECKVVY